MTKDELRKFFKQKRMDMYQSGELQIVSSDVTKNILNSDLYNKSTNIALYYPLKYEIDIRGIVSDKKSFYLPKCIDNNLFFAKYDGNLQSGCFSVQEPKGEIINPEILDVIYVPCLCCNEKKYRLGWGKGFYDRFFNGYDLKVKKIIVSAHCFICNEFEEEQFDFCCDDIICDK